MPRLRKPRALPPGGTIGIAAPAGPVDPELLDAGKAALRDAGFATVHRQDLLARRGYLAGDDARRAKEFMELVTDERVDAILCARGGYGCHRIMSQLDPARVRAAAKPLVGYSDATTLLLWQRRAAGLIGLHGPMLERGGEFDAEALDALLGELTGARPARHTLQGEPGGGGRATGRLVGGSLSLVAASLGTAWEIDTRGAILLVEEVREPPFRIDRMLQQLRAAGKFERVAAVGFGALVECNDPRHAEPSADTVVQEILGSLGVPFVTELPFGHVDRNQVWPVGARAALDGGTGELSILERGVAVR